MQVAQFGSHRHLYEAYVVSGDCWLSWRLLQKSHQLKRCGIPLHLEKAFRCRYLLSATHCLRGIRVSNSNTNGALLPTNILLRLLKCQQWDGS